MNKKRKCDGRDCGAMFVALRAGNIFYGEGQFKKPIGTSIAFEWVLPIE